MLSIYTYNTAVGNISVSGICETIKREGGNITVHHTMKDEYAQLFWFSLFHYSTGYMNFDVRELWDAVSMNMPSKEEWMEKPPKSKLQHVSNIIEIADKNNDVVNLVFSLFSTTTDLKTQ